MHPKEGWRDGRPPIPGVSRPVPAVSRRAFLRRAGAGAARLIGAGGLGSALSACSGALLADTGQQALPLPRPNSPVRWPIYGDNKAIKNGLLPERNATLKIYNWVAYMNPKVLKDFGKKYNCPVEVTTFNTMTEALAKLSSGKVNFDVFMGVTNDVIGKCVAQKVLQPLNHSYIPNIRQTWREYTNPFYDEGWQYTVPYTIYTTGISWRKDHIHDDPGSWPNGYAFPWQVQVRGQGSDPRRLPGDPSLALMKHGIYNLNTTDPAQITLARESLLDLAKLTNVHIDNNDYTNVPSRADLDPPFLVGRHGRGVAVPAEGVPADVIGYWFPADGKGPTANDTNTVLNGAQNPVLAHLFLRLPA